MADYHQRLIKALKGAFGHLNDNRIAYMANKVTNKLRKLKMDVYAVEVSARPFQPTHGAYYTHTDVNVDGTVIYLRITVD